MVMELMERDARLDVLRLIGAFAVVWIHVCAEAVLQVDLSSAAWWLVNLSDAASRWSPAIFLMIGGALLLGRDSMRHPVAFVQARWARLVPAVVFWTAFYLAWRLWRGGLPDWSTLFVEWWRGEPYFHLWFLYMLLGMMLVVPLLRCVVVADNPRLAWYMLAVCALVTVVEATSRVLLGQRHASFLGFFPLFMVFFLGGHLIYRSHLKVAWWVLLGGALLCAVLVALAVGGLYPLIGERAFVLMYSDRGPLVMLSAFCVFAALLAALPRDGSDWRWYRQGGVQVAQVGLGVYALHPFWITTLADVGLGVQPLGFWSIPLVSVLVYILSVASSLCLSRLPGLERVVR